MKTRTRTITVPNAKPLLGASALVILLALILPIYKLWALLLTAALTAGGWFAMTKLFPSKQITVTDNVLSGDRELDARILQAQDILTRFAAAADTASDEGTKTYINRISAATEGIIDEVISDPADKGDTYTFFSYYLPTLDKLMKHYSAFAGMSGENAVESRSRIEGCLKMVADAFEKFLDKLYRSEAVEIKASVDVLKMMLRSDGLASKPDADLESISRDLANEAALEQQQLTGANTQQ